MRRAPVTPPRAAGAWSRIFSVVKPDRRPWLGRKTRPTANRASFALAPFATTERRSRPPNDRVAAAVVRSSQIATTEPCSQMRQACLGSTGDTTKKTGPSRRLAAHKMSDGEMPDGGTEDVARPSNLLLAPIGSATPQTSVQAELTSDATDLYVHVCLQQALLFCSFQPFISSRVSGKS